MNYDQWKLDQEEEQEHFCNVCETPIDNPGICSSRACFKADSM